MEDWKSIKELREIDISLANCSYPMEYLDKKGLLNEDDYYYWNHYNLRIPYKKDFLEIKEENNEVVWRRMNTWQKEERLKEYKTGLGLFTSNDRGEFGGELITPYAQLDGNFVEIFDFQGKVYAIDSLSHLMSLHFALYEFDESGEHRVLYSVGRWEDRSTEQKVHINLAYEAKCVKKDKLYILISGSIISREEEERCYSGESRLLEIDNSQITNMYCFHECFEIITGLIVKNDKVYIGQDKMLTIIDLTDNSITRYTPLEEDAIEVLREQ